MGAMIALGVAGLAASVGGGVMGAMGSASSAKAQAAQAQVNRKWQEFEKEMNLEIQRGQMGVSEMDRLYQNNKMIGTSYETMLAESRAARDQFQYATNQFSRNYSQQKAALSSSSGSRGMGRGGTADALANQLKANTTSDQLRIQSNLNNQLDMFENKRNQQMGQLNARSVDKPPSYLPSTPIPMPNTDGMVMGAMLSGLGQGLGGVSGMMSGMQSTAPSPGPYTPAAVGLNPSQVAAMSMIG